MGEGVNGIDLAPVGVLKYLGNEESSLSALRDMIGKDADQLWATKHPRPRFERAVAVPAFACFV